MRLSSGTSRWAGLCLFVSLGVQPAFSQSLTALNGVVADGTGATVADVRVTVTNDATGLTRSATTTATGWYSIPQLLPGSYSVRAESEGFKTKVVSVHLPVSEVIRLDIALEFGAATIFVDVKAREDTVNRTNAQIGTVFDQARIIDLPSNARNIVGLLSLYPGVTLSDRATEFDRDAGGQVNGARNDQQNIVLDGVSINQQERGGALDGVLPVTLDSVQEFKVQTAGHEASASRASGAQVQLVTRSGSNAWHGSLYEYYRTTGTSARNYFSPETAPLIRHLPGGSVAGPILKNRLFIFGSYEHNSDRSAVLATHNIPTPEFLDGIVRYQRKDGSLGVFTDGSGGALESYTQIPGDRWNPVLIGPGGLFEKYRPFSMDKVRAVPSTTDNGANVLTYRFNAPVKRDRNVYISRMDYNINSRNNFYVRGTLNDDHRTLDPETFPGFDNARFHIDNSKGIAANLNSVITTRLIATVSFGLTREAFEETGNQISTYSPRPFDNFVQTTGASRQAINTWNPGANVSWLKGTHMIEGGFNYRYIDNFLRSFDVANPPLYDAASNVTANATAVGLSRALGAGESANLVSANTIADAILVGTGSLSRFSERVQFDLQGNKLPAGSPFIRDFGLQEWDFFTQDSWKVRPNLTLTYGLHYAVQTPPYERNGIQVNWTEDLGQRWREMRNTTKTADQFPLLATQLSGRANRLADYYRTDTNNLAPRASFAWSPHFNHGILGWLADSGGQMVVRAGYALTYDRIGGRLSRDAATLGSIGLLNAYSLPGSYFSVDGLNGIPRAPRIGLGGSLPREAFPTVTQTNFQVAALSGGPGSLVTAGVDPGLHSPTNHLLNVTVSKELPGDWIVEASYVGRFVRDLVGVVDLASPPNVRDAASGMTWYEATNEVFTRYMQNRTPVNDIQPIDWYENVYPELKGFVESRLGRTFANTTQAWYAYLLQQNPSAASLAPGPNVAVSQIDRWVDVEKALHKNKVLNPQVQYLGLFGNFSRSNYSSGQFSGRKRFGRGVTLTMNYTLAKSLDTTSAAEAQGFRPNVVNLEGVAGDPLNPSRSYALSDFDRRHTFNTNFVADLPIGRGRLFGGNASPILDRVIGGWQVSGVAVAASGRPWDFTSLGRYNRHYVGRDQPELVTSVPFELTKSAAGVFIIPGTAADRARIAAQDFQNSYAGGPVARNQGRGPGYWNADFSATKNINVGENRRLRFRWEAFNLFNHPNFDIPSPTSDGGHNIDQPATLGKITTTLGTERVMQFSFRFEF